MEISVCGTKLYYKIMGEGRPVLLLHGLGCDHRLMAGQSFGDYLAHGILSRRAEQMVGMMLLCPVVIPEPERRTLPHGGVKVWDSDFLQIEQPELFGHLAAEWLRRTDKNKL